MFNKKNLVKILLLVLTLVIVVGVFSSCGSPAEQKSWEETYADQVITNSDDSLGFIDKILVFFGQFIQLITNITWGQYIIALLIFAILVEIIMVPFSILQQKNSRKQAMMRPKEMAIRKKYAGRTDQATQKKLNEEIQELYQKENFNPMSGCLPLLLQLPIIMALYQIVTDPVKYVFGWGGNFVDFVYGFMEKEGVKRVQNGSIAFISDFQDFVADRGGDYKVAFAGIEEYCAEGSNVMEQIDKFAEIADSVNFNIGPVNTGYVLQNMFTNPPENKWLWLLLLVPVLTFVAYFFSSKITRKFTYQPTQSNDTQTGCSNKMMDWMMPLMSVWMTFIVPGAVGIYWIFKSILGVLKQFIISKVMPLPKFTEEDYKAAEREYAGKPSKQKIEKSENAGKVRSLHHIDDEDYDAKGNFVPQKAEEPIEEVQEEVEITYELPKNKLTDGASLKNESDKKAKKPKKDKKVKKDKKEK